MNEERFLVKEGERKFSIGFEEKRKI